MEVFFIVTGIIICRLYYYLVLILIKIWNIARQTIFLIIRIIILETAQKQDFVQFLAFTQGLMIKACY